MTLSLIAGLLGLAASVVTWMRKRAKADNSPAMKANAAAATAQTQADKVTTDITAADAGKPAALEADIAE